MNNPQRLNMLCVALSAFVVAGCNTGGLSPANDVRDLNGRVAKLERQVKQLQHCTFTEDCGRRVP